MRTFGNCYNGITKNKFKSGFLRFSKFEKNDSAKSNPYSKMLQQVNQVQRWESFCQQKIRVKISWHSTYNFLPLILWLEPVVESAQSRWEIVALNCYYIRVHSKILYMNYIFYTWLSDSFILPRSTSQQWHWGPGFSAPWLASRTCWTCSNAWCHLAVRTSPVIENTCNFCARISNNCKSAFEGWTTILLFTDYSDLALEGPWKDHMFSQFTVSLKMAYQLTKQQMNNKVKFSLNTLKKNLRSKTRKSFIWSKQKNVPSSVSYRYLYPMAFWIKLRVIQIRIRAFQNQQKKWRLGLKSAIQIFKRYR